MDAKSGNGQCVRRCVKTPPARQEVFTRSVVGKGGTASDARFAYRAFPAKPLAQRGGIASKSPRSNAVRSDRGSGANYKAIVSNTVFHFIVFGSAKQANPISGSGLL
jgi:hypothetical protein